MHPKATLHVSHSVWLIIFLASASRTELTIYGFIGSVNELRLGALFLFMFRRSMLYIDKVQCVELPGFLRVQKLL